MKTWIYLPEYEEQFRTLAEAAVYLSEQTTADTAEIRCVNEHGETMYIDGVERNENSGEFVYNAYYLGIAKSAEDFKEANVDWSTEFNTEQEALQSDRAVSALLNGKIIRVDLVETTTGETIGILQEGEMIGKI